MKQIMYIGPEVPGVIGKNQIFTFDPEDKKEKVKKIYPAAVNLFVGMDHITEARKEVSQDGTFLNVTYKNFAKKIEEVKDARI